MKSRFHIKSLFGLTSVALLMPVFAIEKPAGEEDLKPKNRVEADEAAPKAVEKEKPAKKIAMLGVGGMAASETLLLHLGLQEGEGLTVYHVAPGSAAEKAGLKRHDILTEFDGQKVGSQQDLRVAVRGKNPGDEVLIKFISRGKAHEQNLVLGERQLREGGLPVPVPGIDPEWLRKDLGVDMPEVDVLPMHEDLKKRMEQMRKRFQQGRHGQGMKLELDKLLKEVQRGDGGGILNLGMSTSVTLMDGDGSITMKTSDGKKEVVVKDKGGEVIFEGPYQTEQDKAAVPEDIRERIDRLDMDKRGNGMKLRVIPPMGVPPAAEEKEEAAE